MLRVEHLDVFHGDAQALDDVCLEIGEGAIVAIVGANGAGKTSLIRTIAGMHRPARGRIAFRGTDIGGWESHRVCNLGIGQVAEGRQIFPTLSVNENLEIGAMLPRAGRCMPAMVLISEVLPAPLAPTMATIDPWSTESETRSSACASP